MSDDGRDTDEPTVILRDGQLSVGSYTRRHDGACDLRTATSGKRAPGTLPGAVPVVLLDRTAPGVSGDGTLERIRERAELERELLSPAGRRAVPPAATGQSERRDGGAFARPGERTRTLRERLEGTLSGGGHGELIAPVRGIGGVSGP